MAQATTMTQNEALAKVQGELLSIETRSNAEVAAFKAKVRSDDALNYTTEWSLEDAIKAEHVVGLIAHMKLADDKFSVFGIIKYQIADITRRLLEGQDWSASSTSGQSNMNKRSVAKAESKFLETLKRLAATMTKAGWEPNEDDAAFELQASGPAFDILCALYAAAEENVKRLEYILEES